MKSKTTTEGGVHHHERRSFAARRKPQYDSAVANGADPDVGPECADSRQCATTVLITLPPGSTGSSPHRHTGPGLGYVIKGEMLFELEGEPQRVIKAEETFWEPGGDVIHYQGANNLSDAEAAYRATLLGVPGQPVLIPVSAEELEEHRDRRAPRP
ncbi:cupin domain-containing protein [Streptomyces sp. NPDC005181]|uniref:cupin domain-containing protein n=1 Tax=Streptomyces sp. NPDC005181 TaxID=3156869 RepID=UPI0033B03C50